MDTLTQLAAQLRSGALPVAAYVEATLAAVDRANAQLLAVLPEPGRRTRLLNDAQTLLARWPDPVRRPPLYGLLVGIKDVLHVAGLPTRAGSALPPEVLRGDEAAIVVRLRQQGALIFGKLVTTEFAYADPGPTCNPHNAAHTPGGSSSGSAAAVGAGLLPLAVGTQTIGSVIRPAAYCGVVGFKPTYGRLPVAGLLHFSPSVDTLGLFAGDVAGMTHAAGALLDRMPLDGSSQAGAPRRLKSDRAAGIRLAVPDGPFMAQVEPAALARFEAALRALAAGGVAIERVPAFADLPELARRHRLLVQREFAAVHAALFAEWGALYRPSAVDACRVGAAADARAYAQSLASMGQLRTWLDATLAQHGCDAWVCPAARGTAPLGLGSTGNPALNLPFSHAGVPAVTVPCDWVETSGGALPLGLQLAGRYGGDEQLLAVAARVEQLLGCERPGAGDAR